MSSRVSSVAAASAFSSMQAFQICIPLLTSPSEFQIVPAPDIPSLLVHLYCDLNMFKIKLIFSPYSPLTCICPTSPREADMHWASPTWIHHSESLLCSCGHLRSSLSMALSLRLKLEVRGAASREGRTETGGGQSRVGENQQAPAGAPSGSTGTHVCVAPDLGREDLQQKRGSSSQS